MKLTIFASREKEGKTAERFEIRRAFFEAYFSLTTQAHQIQTSVASKYIKVFEAPKLETYRYIRQFHVTTEILYKHARYRSQVIASMFLISCPSFSKHSKAHNRLFRSVRTLKDQNQIAVFGVEYPFFVATSLL